MRSYRLIANLVQLEQALQVSEQDVKDASAGVLKDLKRFQLEKEEDLKRYMVGIASDLPPLNLANVPLQRSLTPNAISIGQRRMSKRGGKQRKK